MAPASNILPRGDDWHTRVLELNDVPTLQRLCERCSDYFEEISGSPPGGRRILIDAPDPAFFVEKIILGVFQGAELVGVVDLIVDYREVGNWWIGLFLLDPMVRRQGRGTSIMNALEELAATQGAQKFSLAVKRDYKIAYQFWTKLGFNTTLPSL